MNTVFLRLFLLILFLFNTVNANVYKEVFEVHLKKDEQKKILVKYEEGQKLFQFRWTLFTNGGLVVLRSYDRIVSQNILYLRHKNQSFKVECITKGADNYNVPYMLVKFKEFDYQKKEAIFTIFISDKNSKILLEHLKN